MREPNEQSSTLNREEGPLPLFRDLPAGPDYPVECMGDVLGSAVRGMEDIVQAPSAVCAQSVLAAVNLAAQCHVNVRLWGDEKPISLYLLSIAESGERKTTVDKLALKPITDFQRDLASEFRDEQNRVEMEQQIYCAEKKRVLSNSTDEAEREERLSDLKKPPLAPLHPILLVSEPTYEGLELSLRLGRPGQGLFSSEGGRFLGGHAMKQENRLRTAAALSEMWDGQPISRCRRGGDSFHLYGRRLALHLMMQPAVAFNLLSDSMLIDQGLLSRTLVAHPAPRTGTREFKEPLRTSKEAVSRYQIALRQLIRKPLPLVRGTSNELAPATLNFANDSMTLLSNFGNHIEAKMGPNGSLRCVSGLANKICEHAARIAGTLAVFEDPNAREISRKFVKQALELANYYLLEAQRLYHSAMVDPNLIEARELLDWFITNGRRHVPLVYIYQCGPVAVRDASRAKQLMKILEDHRYVKKLEGCMVVGGVNRRCVYEVTFPVSSDFSAKVTHNRSISPHR